MLIVFVSSAGAAAPVQQCSLFLCIGACATATCSTMLMFWALVLLLPVQQSWLLIFFIRNLMPELDSLAKKSRQLTSAYTLPVCTPSRAALLTGVYPFRWAQRRFVSLQSTESWRTKYHEQMMKYFGVQKSRKVTVDSVMPVNLRWAAQHVFQVRSTQFHSFVFVVRKTQLRKVSKFASALCAIPQLRILPLRAFIDVTFCLPR
jgi:hypothetical protein